MIGKTAVGRRLVAAAFVAFLVIGGHPAAAADPAATSALFAAIAKGDLAAASTAVSRGADLAARNKDGVTPLTLALNMGRLDIARLLQDTQPQSAAVAAAAKGSSDPFDPQYVPAGAFHPVEISSDAAAAMSAEKARAEAAAAVPPSSEPRGRTVPARAAPETTPPQQAQAAAEAPVPAPTPASAQPPAAPTPPAPEGDQGSAAARFFKNLFGGSDSAKAEAPAGAPDSAKAEAPADGADSAKVEAPAAKSPSPPAEQPAQTARLETPASPAEQTPPASRPEKRDPVILEGVTFSVGEELRLGATRDIAYGPNAHPPAGCTLKLNGSVAFCVEPTAWKDGMDKQVAVASVIYRGTKAVVRYDQGAATRIHSLFPSHAFAAVADYYQRKFGPPTDSWLLPVRTPGMPATDNAVQIWQSRSADGSTSVLEIRQYDEARTGFVDRRHGAITLRDGGNRPIFPLVSQFDVMLLKTGGQ